MARITSINARIIHNSRGSKTIEVDVISDNQYLGRTSAPSGASVGKYEAVSFPENGPEQSLRILNENSEKFLEFESNDLKSIDETLKSIDKTSDYSKIGGALAYAVTIASVESASKASGKQLFELISEQSEYKFPIPIGNILGGGAHAGPGTPDIQEILISAPSAKTIRDAIETNFAVHSELRNVIEKTDPSFTNGRGDEGGWAPKCDNEKALELCAKACENLGYTLGNEVSLGVDFASSTQWNEEKHVYEYDRAGFQNTPEEQIQFAADIIEGHSTPIIKEEITGLAEVRDIFDSPKLGKIAGCLVTEGTVIKSNPIRVLRDNTVIYEGELESLKRFKDSVNKVKSGTECGIGVKNYNDVKIGDQIECYTKLEINQ